MKSFRLLACLCALALAASAAAEDLKALNHKARASVVLLKNLDASGDEVAEGTGFVIGNGYIVTNHHVVEGASRMEAVLADKSILELSGILVQDAGHDLAILKAPASHLKPLSLVGADPVEPGERVVVLGNPLGFSSTLSDGIVSAYREKGIEEDPDFIKGPLLQITAPISEGSSGSPVMNLNGEVVGVAVAFFEGGQSLNFAVPASSVRRLLKRVDPKRLEQKFSSGTGFPASMDLLRNLGISTLLFAVIFIAFRRMRR
ncbi:MAG TPA: trypsin-like peptidase domain-containing protein [Thermoanaerobaculia bacterium]|nr:trypsin-like peptidase domain-containing protein [Thermoanaerobaculia bacterium]